MPIGAAVDFHLQHAQIEPHLDFIAAIVPLDDAHGKVVGIVFPTIENRRQIFGHWQIRR